MLSFNFVCSSFLFWILFGFNPSLVVSFVADRALYKMLLLNGLEQELD